MDFTLDEEQEALRDAVRGLLKGYDPAVDAERRRQVTAEDPGFDEDLWGQARRDGRCSGCRSPRPTAAWAPDRSRSRWCAEEIGRVLAPEPYVASVVLAGGLVAALGSRRAARRAARRAGLRRAAAAPTRRDGEGRRARGPGCPRRHDRVAWSATRPFVGDRPDGVAALPDRMTAAGPRGSSSTAAAATPLGAGADVAERSRWSTARAQIAACHEALGAMDTALPMTTSYLTTRASSSGSPSTGSRR